MTKYRYTHYPRLPYSNITKKLKKDDSIQTFLQGLTPTDSTDYSLWKVTKKIKQIAKSSPPLRIPQGTWTRNNAEKAHTFVKHLEQIFQPNPLENTPEEEDLIPTLGNSLPAQTTNQTPQKNKFKKSSKT
jgi:hypothetical protein